MGKAVSTANPSGRSYHGMAAVGRYRVLMFGGTDIGGYDDETWLLHGPGITVRPTSGLTTTEAGGTGTYDVSADTPPRADVTVPLGSSDPTEGTVPVSVVLPADSTAPVTVTGVDDAILDGDIGYAILPGDPTSTDVTYDALGAADVADVSATNQDDEGAGTNTPAVFRISNVGEVLADHTVHAAAFAAGAADVAEWITVSEPVEAGDVLELDPTAFATYRLSRTACSSLAAVLLGSAVMDHSSRTTDHSEALFALTGIGPVKVTDEGGPIEPGDLLVTSSTPGHAMRWDGTGSPSLVGKALEPMTDDYGVILVLLTAH